ncbi:MAG: MmgE/PrpD family protein [Marmoricola sp.]
MTTENLFRRTEQKAATEALAAAAVSLRDEALPPVLAGRCRLVLTDLWAVTLRGARTPELQQLARTAPGPTGSTRTVGSTVSTTPEGAGFLDAVASCCLELDEGNKYAAGHPAAHVVFAAMAAARVAGRPVDGATFLAAVVAGYEVAARFGRASHRDPRWHPHGHWGATGAATAAALVLGAREGQVAAAIDAATSLVQVTPWQVVLEGGFARNLWMAGANRAGLEAARLSVAGLVSNDGAAQHSLGDLVGSLDPQGLTAGLGSEWLVLQGYAKQHSSCSYTHAVVDAVQAIRHGADWTADDVTEVVVRTHRLAEPLLETEPDNRLGAMFSLPFVTAMSLVSDAVDPDAMDPGGERFARARDLRDRINVQLSPELDELLPGRRAAEVEVHLRDGTSIGLGVPNPVGDVDHLPFGEAEILEKSRRLVGADDTARIAQVVKTVAGCDDVVRALDLLP